MVGRAPAGGALPWPARGGVRAAGGGGLELDNLLLLSMLVATVAVPAVGARARHGRRALAWTLLLLVGFTLAYVFLVSQYYANHYVPEPFEP
jgi:hypothetical protein